jgi:hypothetical protein
MPISFVAAGTAVAGVLTTLDLVAPTLAENDIIIAQIASNDNDAVAMPTAAWTVIQENNNGTGLRSTVAWKRALTADSGATFQFTGLAGTTVNFGVLTVYRGVIPHGPAVGTSTTSANISADDVTYATLTPRSNAGVIIACGYYQNDLTTAGAMSDASFTNVVDEETPTGNDLSLFQYWAPSSGAATGALTHSTTSTADAVSNGDLFDLIADNMYGGGGVRSPKYARLNRRQLA